MCVNTTGSYDCTCIAGYEGDGFNCTGTHTVLIVKHCCKNSFKASYLKEMSPDMYIAVKFGKVTKKQYYHNVGI